MAMQAADTNLLRRALQAECVKALGLPSTHLSQGLLAPLTHAPMQTFARIANAFDRNVIQHGLQEAVRRVLPHFCQGVEARGVENLPDSGPLLVVGNHPGTADALTIAQAVERNDLRLVMSGAPFFRHMTGLSLHAIHTPPRGDDLARMAMLRNAMGHLSSGGALLILPGGRISPDPDLLPGAREHLRKWSRSIEVMLRHVPQTRLVIAITSGLLSPEAWRHPLARLRQGRRQRQLLAEFVQVIGQTFLGRNYEIISRLSFAPAVTVDELREEGDGRHLMPPILARARALLEEHMAWGPGEPLFSEALPEIG